MNKSIVALQLMLLAVLAQPNSFEEVSIKVKSFWHSANAIPVTVLIAASLVFICCCAIPKLLKVIIFGGTLAVTGYFAYTTLSG